MINLNCLRTHTSDVAPDDAPTDIDNEVRRTCELITVRFRHTYHTPANATHRFIAIRRNQSLQPAWLHHSVIIDKGDDLATRCCYSAITSMWHIIMLTT